MKKLEDIPKNSPFSVPDGYFEKLPGVIQARVSRAEKSPVPYVRYAFQYALPVIAVLVALVLYVTPTRAENYDELLSSVSSEELAAYLADSEVTSEEILDVTEFDDESVEAIEDEVYFNNIDLTGLDDIEI